MREMSAHRPSFQPNGKSKSFLESYDGSIGCGIISPALSVGGSTTVTPITPMTPMTTPRTPLQILLGWQNFGVLNRPHRRPPMLPHQNSTLSDEEEEENREKQMLALQLFANFLNTVETMLNDITERENSGHQVLGVGIVRMCRDLASEIEGLAKELHREHIQAAEHLEQVSSGHELSLIEECSYRGTEEKSNLEAVDATNESALALSPLALSESTCSFQSHDEFIVTLSTTHTLLLDMAAALRVITEQEAQELGEVALEVARMFVWSLGMVHSNMTRMTVTNDFQQSTSSVEGIERQEEEDSIQKAAGSIEQNRVTWSEENTNSCGLGPVFEISGEEEKKDVHALNYPGTPTNNMVELMYTPQLSPIPSSPKELSSPTMPTDISNKHTGARVRVLWPPLLTTVTVAGKHCASNAKEHPIPAIAIGLTCGPVAIATAAIAGPPLLVADWAIQNSYDVLSKHTPVIENVEKGAANALQMARLATLCSKLLVKQGMSVGERQIERRGGVGKVCSDVVGGAVGMALHPVETVGEAWEGLFWMGGGVRDAVGFVKDFVNDKVSGGELQTNVH